MDDQPMLFKLPKPVAVLRPLTERQQRIYTLICSKPGGLTAVELGQILHSGRGRHPVDDQCEFCGRDGMRSIKERGIRQRVIRRQGGVYEAIDPDDRADAKPSLQLVELPGDSFEDIFIRKDAAA